jgi:hypothetical protein
VNLSRGHFGIKPKWKEVTPLGLGYTPHFGLGIKKERVQD